MPGHKFPNENIENETDDAVEESTVSTDMALAKAIDFMNSPKNVDIKTDIPNEAVPFVVALTQEDDFTEGQIMGKFIKNFKILRVSKDRKSREEIIELAKNRREFDNNNPGMIARMTNWLRGGNSGGM